MAGDAHPAGSAPSGALSAAKRALPRQPHRIFPCLGGVVRFDGKLFLAIGAVWFIWGSTFAGMRYAVETVPPFAMAASRFGLAGAILYGVCASRGHGRFTRTELVQAFVSGAALLLLGNGMTAYTVQFLPTGINALLLSSVPIWTAIIAFAWGGERPRPVAIAGMLLGLAGLALLVGPPGSGAFPIGPALLAIAASVAWSFGSVYGRRVGTPGNVLLATALQMLAGGLLLAIEAAVTGEWTRFNVHAVSAASLAGFAWLVVFGSIVAYSAYQYTMQNAGMALAMTFAYVNPIVSIGVGYVLFGERLTSAQGIASAIIVSGVALMMLPGAAAPARAVPARRSCAEDAVALR